MGRASGPSNSDQMSIREFCEADLVAVIGLWDRTGLIFPQNDPREDIAFARESGHGNVLVLEEAGALIGAVMVGHDGHRGWIYYLCVDPEQQKDGKGESLVRAAEQWLKSRGVRKLELQIRDTNTAVKDFYQKIGYEHEPVTIMARWLDPKMIKESD